MKDLNFIFTLVCGEVPEKARETIARNTFFCKYHGIEFKVLPFEGNRNEPHGISADKERLKIAAENECVMYCDWDLLIVDLPPINPLHPSFALFTETEFDIFFFYNGRYGIELFSDYIVYHEKKYGDQYIGTYFKTVNEFFNGKCQIIPPSCYKHYGLAAWR
jgi:hypothetical protein